MLPNHVDRAGDSRLRCVFEDAVLSRRAGAPVAIDVTFAADAALPAARGPDVCAGVAPMRPRR